MKFFLVTMFLRVLDPIRDAAWRVVQNHTDLDAVARFANERLARGGMSVRVVPGPLPRVPMAPKANTARSADSMLN